MGGSFVIAYSIDDSAFALTMSALNLLLSLAATFITLAAFRRQSGLATGEATSQEIQVQRELTRWGIDARDLDDEAGREVVRRLIRLKYWPGLGVWLGALCVNVSACVAAYALTSSFAILLSNSYLVSVLEFFFVAMCSMSGVTLGGYFETRGSSSATADSGERPRRVSDYCAWWLGLAPLGASALSIATLWMLFRQSSDIHLSLGDSFITAPTIPTLGALLVIAVLVPVLSVLCIYLTVASPRRLLATNPVTTRTADDFRRATAIGVILGGAWIASGFLMQAVVSIEWRSQMAHSYTLTNRALSVAFFLGSEICIAGGTALLFLRGRLGGTLTGWRNPFVDMRFLEHGQEL